MKDRADLYALNANIERQYYNQLENHALAAIQALEGFANNHAAGAEDGNAHRGWAGWNGHFDDAAL